MSLHDTASLHILYLKENTIHFFRIKIKGASHSILEFNSITLCLSTVDTFAYLKYLFKKLINLTLKRDLLIKDHAFFHSS